VKPLIWAFYDAINEERVAMRVEDWKILCRLKSDTTILGHIHNMYAGNEALIKEAEMVDFELYDMKKDMGETKNVAQQYPKVFNEIKTKFKEEYKALLDDSYVWKREEVIE
jgi:arylsulfatase A